MSRRRLIVPRHWDAKRTAHTAASSPWPAPDWTSVQPPPAPDVAADPPRLAPDEIGTRMGKARTTREALRSALVGLPADEIARQEALWLAALPERRLGFDGIIWQYDRTGQLAGLGDVVVAVEVKPDGWVTEMRTSIPVATWRSMGPWTP